MLESILIMVALVVVFYVLYINGYMIVNAKRATLFFGTNRGKAARFASCSGYIKRVIRFKESKDYQFTFETELEKGEVSVELWDGKKEKMLLLTNRGEATVTVESKKRYYLVLRFESATGSYNMEWH